MNTVYFLLGSNIGHTEMQVETAVKYIENEIGAVICRSSLYSTAPWGKQDQADFLNQVIIAETEKDAKQTLTKLLSIEEKMGRIRVQKNDPRIIDIDILFFNEDIVRTNTLTIPHPQIAYRRFVLVPLAEIAPSFIHPVLHKTNQEMLAECTDELNVQKI